jgi:hypothetical protein
MSLAVYMLATMKSKISRMLVVFSAVCLEFLFATSHARWPLPIDPLNPHSALTPIYQWSQAPTRRFDTVPIAHCLSSTFLGCHCQVSTHIGACDRCRRQMQYAAWNKSTIVDILVLILKVIVAAALIGHAHHIKGEIQPEPVYGVLDDPTYAYSAEAATDMLVRVSWIAGGYVMVASAIGLIGRCLHAAPLYGVYYCANIFGFAVCLTAAIIPTVWGTTRKGLCLAAEASCLAVEDLSLCPYPVSSFATQTRQRVLADPTEGVSGAEGAVTMASSSPCCYLPSFFSFCEHFFGAVYTQTVIAVVLLALVMTQSMISCCYLCCDCDRRKYFVWDWEPAKLPVCSSSLLSCVLGGAQAFQPFVPLGVYGCSRASQSDPLYLPSRCGVAVHHSTHVCMCPACICLQGP